MQSLYFILFFLFLIPIQALSFSIEGNVFYYTDNLKSSSQNTYNRTNYDLSVTMNIDKKGTYILGWNIGSISHKDSIGGTTTSFTSSDMGPLLRYTFTKEKDWFLDLVYGITATGKYVSGSTSQTWRGTSTRISFGYRPRISDHLFIGLLLNQYTGSYTESLVGTSLTTVTYSKTALYPSVTVSYLFGD